MPEMRPVFSSHINAIGYEDGDLHVTFKDGKTAVYSDVPEDVAGNVMGAPSIGSAHHALIRDKYQHKYL